MPQTVLVTRPYVQAREFAAEIEKIGFTSLIQPLLDIHSVLFSFGTIQKPQAILLTSLHGLGSEKPPLDWLDIPVFTVGLKTKDVARDVGFQNTYSGGGDIGDVIPLIREHVPARSRFLYLRGEHIQHDAKILLPDYQIDEKITYDAKPVSKMDNKILDSFANIDILTLFSARSGMILKDLLSHHHLTSHLQSIKLLCLSHAVLESVQELNWASCHVAENPTAPSMIKTCERLRNE